MSKTIQIDESQLPVGMVVGRYKARIAELEQALDQSARTLHGTHADLMYRSERRFEDCSGGLCVAARAALSNQGEQPAPTEGKRCP